MKSRVWSCWVRWGFCFGLVFGVFALLSALDIALNVSNLETGIILKDNTLPHHTTCQHCCKPSGSSVKRPQGNTW